MVVLTTVLCFRRGVRRADHHFVLVRPHHAQSAVRSGRPEEHQCVLALSLLPLNRLVFLICCVVLLFWFAVSSVVVVPLRVLDCDAQCAVEKVTLRSADSSTSTGLVDLIQSRGCVLCDLQRNAALRDALHIQDDGSRCALGNCS